jgi:hypothetical protein
MNPHCQTGVHCAACQGRAEVMVALKVNKCEGPFTPAPSQLDAALQAQARGEVYAPPGKCRGCGQ